MAKKNVRDEPPKTQVTENAQLSDIVFILDKMELLLQAISDIDKNGRYKTVSADKKHRNSFLKIDRYASMFENFLKNFWSQLKDPTRFGILSVKENALDNPEVRQAIEDLAAGRKSDAVEEFLKKYEIVPRSKENQSINHQNQEEMAKKFDVNDRMISYWEQGQRGFKIDILEKFINLLKVNPYWLLWDERLNSFDNIIEKLSAEVRG